MVMVATMNANWRPASLVMGLDAQSAAMVCFLEVSSVKRLVDVQTVSSTPDFLGSAVSVHTVVCQLKSGKKTQPDGCMKG
jgi:hypothetical protein